MPDTFRATNGDLLSYELWNRLVERANMLEERILQLETAESLNSPAILELNYSEPLRLGDEMTVIGRNLQLVEVLVAARLATVFRVKTSERLTFAVPAIPGWTTVGLAEVQVRDPASRRGDSRYVTLHPASASALPTPNWATGVAYNVGDRALFMGQPYRALQPHRSQPAWTPNLAPALWQRVS
jgi:hypothetical protein